MGSFDGTVVGAPTWPTALSLSNTRNAANYGACFTNAAGSGSVYITLPPGAAAPILTGTFSVRVRVRCTTAVPATQTLLSVMNGAAQLIFALYLINGKPFAHWGGGSYVGSTNTIADSAWHEVVYTRVDSNGATCLFVDGTQVNLLPSSASGLAGPVATVSVGADLGATPLTGSIDDLAIYNVYFGSGASLATLSAPEAANGTNVTALYHLDGNAADAHATLTLATPVMGALTNALALATDAGAAGGSLPYAYQWYRSSTGICVPSLTTLLAGQTAANLSDATVVPSRTYAYVLQVTDSAGGLVTSATLHATIPAGALVAPTIALDRKSSRTVVIGAAVPTGGVSPYSYQWYRSTSTGFTPGAGNILAGMTTLALSDTTVAALTTYYYKLVVTDAQAVPYTATSAQLGVTTLAAPLALGVPTLGSVTTTSISLTAPAATGGTGPYTYQWYRSQLQSFTPGAPTILSGKTALALVDSTALAGTTYYYRCVATDSVAATIATPVSVATTLPSGPQRYPMLAFLAAGDGVQAMGSATPDAVPSSGDYLNLVDGVNYLVEQFGIAAAPRLSPASTAGAPPRIASARSLPTRLITLQLIVKGGVTDATSVWANWRALEHKLEQAKQGQGPLGKGLPVVLALRYSTTPTIVNQLGFTFFEVLEGTMTPVDKGVNPSGAYGCTLLLTCLPYGHMSSTTWPAALAYSASVTNGAPGTLYVGPTVPAWVGSGAAIGAVEGTLAALGTLRVRDQSTAGAINRIRIGRRAINGPGGGMAEGDFSGVVNCAAIAPAALLTSQANAVGGDIASLSVTDGNWHDLGRATSGTTAPAYSPGNYDVFARVREAATPAAAPAFVVVTPTAISDFGAVLPPDRYTVRVGGNTSGGAASLATAALSVTTVYPWTPNIFEDGFERGDASAWEQVQNACSFGAGGAAVSSAYALCGNYGLRVTGSATFPLGTQVAGTPWGIVDLGMRSTFTLPDANPLYAAAWMQLGGGVTTTASMALLFLGSSVLDYTEQPINGATLYPYPFGGMIAAFGIKNGVFGVLAKGTAGAVVFSPLTNLNPADLASPFWVKVGLSPASVATAGTYSATVWLYTRGGYFVATVTGAMALAVTAGFTAPSPVVPDYVQLGARLGAQNASIDARFDDARVWTSVVTTDRPSQGLLISYQDRNDAPATLYVQQGDQTPLAFASPGPSFTLDTTLLGDAAAALLPTSPVPAPAQFRARFSVLPDNLATPVNTLLTGPVPATLGGGQWHCLNLGTLALPPASRIAGLAPASGTVFGDAGWQLDIQGMSGSAGANTLDVDALWLFPHDEPQFVAEFPALANTAPLEWVCASRLDGRSGAFLLDMAGNLLGQANSLGQVLLAPGNQSLVLLVEREGGVHDVTNTKFALQLTTTPLTWWFNDSASVY